MEYNLVAYSPVEEVSFDWNACTMRMSGERKEEEAPTHFIRILRLTHAGRVTKDSQL